MNRFVIFSFIVTAALLPGHATLVQQFEFNDSNGTTLSNAANSVGGGVQYASDLTGYVINGGNLEISSVGDTESFSGNGTALGYTSGIYQIDMTLDWTVVDDGVDQTFHVSFMNDNVNQTTADISLEFRTGNTNVEVNGRAFGGGTETGVYSGFTLNESNIQLRSVVDFDNDTLETFYNSGSGFVSTGTAGTISSSRNGNWLRIRTTGDWSDSGESLSVDSISYSVIPEPGSMVLVGVAFLTLFGAYRLRRS